MRTDWKIDRIEYPELQKSIKPDIDERSVRLDVYGECKMKEKLNQYAKEVLLVDGLETYIISSEYYHELPGIWASLQPNSYFQKVLLSYVKVLSEINKIELAIGVSYNPHLPSSLQWRPVLCYLHDGIYYHVEYKEHWRCIDCKYDQHRVIMQLVDHEPDAYFGVAKPYNSDVFKKNPL